MTRWRWINHEGTTLREIGVNPDGTLHNPHGYPPGTVRAAITAAEARRHERRSTGARKAAQTRRERQKYQTYEAVRRIASGEICGPRTACFVCGRGLTDEQARRRGIGPECWQSVLAGVTAEKAAHAALAQIFAPPNGRPAGT